MLARWHDELAPGDTVEHFDQAVAQRRQEVLAPRILAATIEAMIEDSFVSRSADGGEGLCLPGDEHARVDVFHGEALSEAVAAHLDEVRRWSLSAPDPALFVRLAIEHGRVLTAATLAANSMLRDGVRRRVESRLEALSAVGDSRTEQTLAILLTERGLPLAPTGLIDAFRAAEQLLPEVLEPTNVELTLQRMADQDALLVLVGATGERRYVDPELVREARAVPERIALLQAELGVGLSAETLTECASRPAAPARVAEPAALPDRLAAIKDRLRALKEFHEEGLISDAEYDRRRGEILDEV